MSKLLLTFVTVIFATGTLGISSPAIPVTLPDLPPTFKLKDRSNLFIDSWRVRGVVSISNAVVRGLDTLQTNLTFSPYQVKLNGDVSLSRLEICTDYHGHIDYMKDGTVVQTKGEGHLCFQGSNIRVLNILQPIRFCPSLLKLQLPKPEEVIDLTVEDVQMNVTGVSINGEPSDGDRLAVVSKEYGYPLGFAFARAVLNSNVPNSFVEQTITSLVASIFLRD